MKNTVAKGTQAIQILKALLASTEKSPDIGLAV